MSCDGAGDVVVSCLVLMCNKFHIDIYNIVIIMITTEDLGGTGGQCCQQLQFSPHVLVHGSYATANCINILKYTLFVVKGHVKTH